MNITEKRTVRYKNIIESFTMWNVDKEEAFRAMLKKHKERDDAFEEEKRRTWSEP